MKTLEGTQRKLKAKAEIRNLKIKCHKCNRAYSTAFFHGKGFCQKCFPKKRKYSLHGRGRFG